MGTVCRQKGRSAWMIKVHRDGGGSSELADRHQRRRAQHVQHREAAILDGLPVRNKMGKALRRRS